MGVQVIPVATLLLPGSFRPSTGISATGNWHVAVLLVAGLYAANAVLWSGLNPKGTVFSEEDVPRP